MERKVKKGKVGPKSNSGKKRRVTGKRKVLEKRAEGLPFKELDHRVLADETLTPSTKAVLLSIPLRNEEGVSWKICEEGLVTLRYRKEFGRFESWLFTKVGGSEYLNVPLDEVGSFIWTNCDGNHTIAEICMMADRRYSEKVEPCVPRIVRFFEILLKRGLVYLKSR